MSLFQIMRADKEEEVERSTNGYGFHPTSQNTHPPVLQIPKPYLPLSLSHNPPTKDLTSIFSSPVLVRSALSGLIRFLRRRRGGVEVDCGGRDRRDPRSGKRWGRDSSPCWGKDICFLPTFLLQKIPLFIDKFAALIFFFFLILKFGGGDLF